MELEMNLLWITDAVSKTVFSRLTMITSESTIRWNFQTRNIHHSQCDQIGRFLEVRGNFFTKIAQIFCDI